MLGIAHLVLWGTAVFARQITVKNSCQTTIWPGMHTGAGTAPGQATGWQLNAMGSTTFTVSDNWTAGRIWARTGCTTQTSDGSFQCLTGSCGSGAGGDMTCLNSDQPPATLAEFTLTPNGEDNYDVSLVDGFNIPLIITPSISTCTSPSCPVNINALCPPLLRTALDSTGKNLACLTACNAGFGQEEYGNRDCCTGGYNDPIKCAICGVDYYNLFKDNCKSSYAYAYDEKSGTALWTCPTSSGSMADYTIEFCPANSDYVGLTNPSSEYESSTATCSNIVTAFSQTFTVSPSPTKTATIGTFHVAATVATGVNGAAAVAINGGTSQASGGSSTSAASASVTSTASGGIVVGQVSVQSTAAQSSSASLSSVPTATATSTSSNAISAASAISNTATLAASPTSSGSTETITVIGSSILLEKINGVPTAITLATNVANVAAASTSSATSSCLRNGGQWLHPQEGVQQTKRWNHRRGRH